MTTKDNEEVLIRYREVTEDTIDALRKDKLFLSSPDHFNDPFDSVCYIDKEKLRRSILQALENGKQDGFFDIGNITQLIKEKLPGDYSLTPYDYSLPQILAQSDEHCSAFIESMVSFICETRDDITRNSKVACFSELHQSILMWSHYAKDHKGFAIIYTTDSLRNAEVYTLSEEKIRRRVFLDKVHYSEKTLDSGQLFFDETPEYCKTGKWSTSFGQSHLFNKLSEWNYEKEWRLWIVQNDFSHSEEASYLFVKPYAVILGTKMTMSDRKKVFESIKGRDIILLDSCPVFDGARFELTLKGTDTKEIRSTKTKKC